MAWRCFVPGKIWGRTTTLAFSFCWKFWVFWVLEKIYSCKSLASVRCLHRVESGGAGKVPQALFGIGNSLDRWKLSCRCWKMINPNVWFLLLNIYIFPFPHVPLLPIPNLNSSPSWWNLWRNLTWITWSSDQIINNKNN